MNELLAQAYGTKEKLAQAAAGAKVGETDLEKTAEAALLTQLEKIAADNGVDLALLSDDDIVEIINGAKSALETPATAAASTGQAASTVKTAAASDTGAGETGAGETGAGEAAVKEADFLGRVMAHALFDEVSAIQSAQQEKTATGMSAEDEAKFEELALARANAILADLAGQDAGEFEKQAGAEIEDEMLDAAISQRAADILDANGFDVAKIMAGLAEKYPNQ